MEEPEILIVDDNPEIREVAMVLLARGNCRKPYGKQIPF